MDVRQLGYFLAVAETLHFGRAAERLHLAQPSLSQAIGTLERELGVPLFHRVPRGVVLSDAGAQLVEPARQVVRDLEAARSAARSTRGLTQGRVELVAMPSPGLEPLTSIVRQFTEAHPGMRVRVDAAFDPEEVVLAVKTGSAELGLLGAASPPLSEGLHVLPIEDQPLVLLSAPGSFPHEDPTTIDRAGLQGARLIVSREGSLMRRMVDDVLASGIEATIVVEVEHRTTMLPMVLAGVGHAVLPASWRALALRAGAEVREVSPAVHLRVSLVSRSGSLTPAAHAFRQQVVRYIESRPAG